MGWIQHLLDALAKVTEAQHLRRGWNWIISQDEMNKEKIHPNSCKTIKNARRSTVVGGYSPGVSHSPWWWTCWFKTQQQSGGHFPTGTTKDPRSLVSMCVVFKLPVLAKNQICIFGNTSAAQTFSVCFTLCLLQFVLLQSSQFCAHWCCVIVWIHVVLWSKSPNQHRIIIGSPCTLW